MYLSVFLIFVVVLWTKLQSFFQRDANIFQKNKLLINQKEPIPFLSEWNEDYFKAYFSKNNYKIEIIKNTLFAYKIITNIGEKKLKKSLLEIFVWLDSAESLEYGVRKIESSFQTKGKVIRNLNVITFEFCNDESCPTVSSGFSFEKTAHYFITIIPVGIHTQKRQLYVLHSDTFHPSLFFKHSIEIIYHSTMI
jgi:hypothetical protein